MRSSEEEDVIMNLRISGLITALAVSCLLGSAQTLAQNAYITNQDSDNISVIDTPTNTVIATIPAGEYPEGVAVSQDGRRAYITNRNRLGSGNITGTVMVIDTTTNTVIGSPIRVGNYPAGVAVSPDGSKV
jgi:YVTN family beta-propeller protein